MNKQFVRNNNIRFICSGTSFFSTICRMILSAKYTVHLHTYIFNHDETGRAVADALIRAAQNNVDVFLLVDGYASQHLPADFIQEILAAGIRFRFFEPVFQSRHLYFGRRLHHKVVVVDGACAMVGGLNIADRYNDLPGIPAWFDLALYTEGGVAAELNRICRNLWSKNGRIKKLPPSSPAFVPHLADHEGVAMRVRRNDWVKRKQEITSTYTELFRSAKDSITIVCSYFLPGRAFRRQLRKAAARGVRVRVILASLSDIPLSKYAERYLYRWMLRHHISIFEYQPTILHAKIAMADDTMLTIGSYNINNISRYASIELNLDVKDRSFVREVAAHLEKIIEKDCRRIDQKTAPDLFSFRQFLHWGAYQFIRVIMSVSTFYFRQQE